MQLFGMNFLVMALLKRSEYAFPILNESLRSKLVSLSLSEITVLYRYINKSIAQEHRQPLLMQLNQYITDEVALTLLSNNDVSLWSLLKVRPNLINQIDVELFKLKVENMKEDEIGHAFDFANSGRLQLDGLRQDIYIRIAAIKSRNPALPIDVSILARLKANEAVQAWVKAMADDYKKTLCLQMNHDLQAEFTTDSYQRLCDFMNAVRPSYRALQDMSEIKLDLPMDNHARDGWILTLLYQSSERPLSKESLNAVLDIMLQGSEYGLDELNRWKACILVASLYQPFSDSDLHNFLWDTSTDFIELWSQALRSDNVGRVLASTCVKTFKSRLDAIFGALVCLKGKGEWLGNVMRYLNEEQCKLFLDAFKDSLSTSILDNSHESSLALRCLNTEKSRLLLAVVKNDIKNYIDLTHVLQSLDLDNCHLLLEEIKGNINTIIRNSSELGLVLSELNEEKCCLLLDVVKENSSIINHLGDVLLRVDEAKCLLILHVMKGHLFDIFEDGYQLGYALHHLSEVKSRLLIDALQDRLPGIISNGTQLGVAIHDLNEGQCRLLFGALQDNLSKIIPDVTQLIHATSSLSEATYRLVLDVLQHIIPKIIKDGTQLCQALGRRHSGNQRILINRLRDNLHTIIQNSAQLGAVIDHVESSVCSEVLDVLKDNLSTLIPDVNHLCKALRASNGSHVELLLGAVQGNILASIQDNAQLVALLNSLPNRDSAFTLLIEHLEDRLPDLIQTELELDRTLSALQDRSHPKKLVLEAIKGRLPNLTPARVGEQHCLFYRTQDTIRNTIKESHHSWFNPARASTINIGSLKHKLEGYIEAKQRECSLHFDFLYLKCFIGWILGYNARDEKVSAAQYILDVINNQEDTQRVLTPIMRQSLEHGLLGDIVKGHGGVDMVLEKYRRKNQESQGLSDRL